MNVAMKPFMQRPPRGPSARRDRRDDTTPHDRRPIPGREVPVEDDEVGVAADLDHPTPCPGMGGESKTVGGWAGAGALPDRRPAGVVPAADPVTANDRPAPPERRS
jgi:hypothetical protein